MLNILVRIYYEYIYIPRKVIKDNECLPNVYQVSRYAIHSNDVLYGGQVSRSFQP